MIFSVTRPSGDDAWACPHCGRHGVRVGTLDVEPTLEICEACLFAAVFGGSLPEGYKPRHYPTKAEREAEKERQRQLKGALSLTEDARGRVSLVPDDVRGRLTLATEREPHPAIRPDAPWWKIW